MFAKGKKGPHHKGSAELYKAATTDYCYICKAVLAYYVKLVKDVGLALANGWLRRVEYEFICYNGDSGVNIGATLGPPPVRACVTFTWSPYGEVPDSLSPPVEGPGTLNALEAVTGHQDIGCQQRLYSTKGEPTIQTTVKWLNDCLNSHESCTKQVERDGAWYPPRLIDVGVQHPKLILTSSESQVGPYATLSHCWGPNPSFLQLSKSNMDEFQNEIRLQDLPQTFRDAIEVVRWFSIRYLWIDSLCIQQSGEGSNKDWQYHASIMDRIYSKCVLNIAAAWAQSAHGGCFSTRQSEVAERCIAFARSFKGIEGIQGIRSTADSNLTAVHESPLSARGWVLQERMLSPRVLSFGQDQVFWECNKLRNGSEAYPCGFDTHTFYPVFDIPLTVSQWGCSWLWARIIEDYSGKSLSHPLEDGFVALSAIARQITQLKDDWYIAGLFWRDFPAQLLWEVKPSHSFLGRTTRPTGNYRAPTWSWASLDGPVTAGPLSLVSDSQMAKIIEGEIALADERNPEGQIAAAQLILEGPVTAMNWSIKPPHPFLKDAGPRAVVSSLSCDLQHLNESDEVVVSEIFFDDRSYLQDDQSGVFAIPFKKWDFGVMGLIIRRQVDSLEETYTRLGIFRYWNPRTFDEAPQKTITLI